jgi:hypothetical protein
LITLKISTAIGRTGHPGRQPILGPIDREKVARTVSQWVHHFPVARKDDAKQWPAETLPKPQRSSWK